MRNSKVLELNSTLELLTENELYAFKGGLEGGQSEHEIPEVIITVPGGDDGGGNDPGGNDDGNPPTWDDDDPPYGGDGDDPFPPDGGGDPDGSNASEADGILETPTAREILWLLLNTSGADRDKMRHNAALAAQYGKGQVDNVYDALRHAMWSAMDAADIGLDKAKEFHTLHETVNPGNDNTMDLHNNDWGFNWFSQHGNPDNNMQQFINDFNAAVASGQIQTHP